MTDTNGSPAVNAVDPVADSMGCIGNVEISPGSVRILGWASATFARPVSHRVFLDGRELAILGLADRLHSPQVQKLYPSLVDAEFCCFYVDAALPADFDPAAMQLFAYEPVFPQATGRRFFFVRNPRIPMPSAQLADSVGGHFAIVGYEFLGFAYNFMQLRPDAAVLDAGCGIGRMAFGLAPYLDKQGRYEGFDIAADMIQWAQRNITPHHPRFRFQVADVFNSYYNPRGRSTSADYVFPFPDASFDAATLMSVFTHMDQPGVDNYFAQLARVLKPGGKCMVTAFLLDDETRASAAPAMRFSVPYGKFWSTEKSRPEAAVAIDRTMFLEMAARHGFSVRRQFPGAWSGRPNALTLQDLMILER